ncbi:MAG: chloride channel protein, partial [Candidatus Kariarchaeaceae archaeon]
MSMFFNRILSLGKISDEDRFEAHIKQWIPLALLIGIIVGFLMSAFYIVILLIAKALSYLSYPLIGMAVAGIIIAILVFVNFENPNENGITYVISQRHQEKPIPPEVGAKKFVNSAITIGSGLPVGREGPALIIGSAIATKIASWGNVPEEYQHQAITLGSAASTGALFQAPFGSAIFAAEVPYKEDSDEPMLMAAFLASVSAAVTAKSIISLVNSKITEITLDIFHLGAAELNVNVYNSVLAILLGIIAGLIGRFFIEFYYNYTDRFIQRFKKHIQILIGLSIALLVISVGVILIPDFYITEGITSFDVISEFITDAMNDDLKITILFIAIIIEIVATTAIIGSGFPGGIFGPSLSIGAQSGIIFAILLNVNDPVIITAWAIVGMSSMHAATTKTPVASVLLILEITGLPNLIIPMVLANISAYIVSGPKSLYRGQLRSRDAKLMGEL